MPFTFFDFPPWKGGQTIARGERSEPLVIGSEYEEAPAGAQDIDTKGFRPFRALSHANSYQGFAALTPGYYLIAASRLKK
jgi:hypothetical protein